MINKHKYHFLVLLSAMWIGMSGYAQTGDSWLENTMFASGKINVVVAVVAAVFVLITIYMISIDRKLKKIEESEKRESK
jgi:CcmD family protein